MLGTRDRTLLLENLRPPPGYCLRMAVGTSYTLDLVALLTAPLAFTFFDAHDDDGQPIADPVALLEALRRHSENVTLFCQAGAITVPPPEQSLLSYLEGSVVEVKAPKQGGIFHPKVWVLAYGTGDGPAIYRVLCLSRNFTFSRSWDTCLCLEGPLIQRQRGFSRNKPLADLLLELPSLAVRPIGAELDMKLKSMAAELQRVDFKPPQPFTDFRIHHLGLRASPKLGPPWPPASRSLVMSPYLAPRVVRRLVKEHGLRVLISRPEELEKVVRDGLAVHPRACYVLSPTAHLDTRDAHRERPDGAAPPIEEDPMDLTGLHAKLFLFEEGREARLFTGSANATAGALQCNVELLVELVGEKKDCGIASLLGSDEDVRTEALRSLLQSYTPTGDRDPETGSRGLEKSVEHLSRSIASVPLTATVVRAEEAGRHQQRWCTSLSGDIPEIPDEARVRAWPVTLMPDAAKRIFERSAPYRSTDRIAKFDGMSLEALTGFFAFEVSLTQGQDTCKQRFVVTADLIGAPEDRKERLLRSLLKDRRRVLRILLLILMGEGGDPTALVQASRGADRVSEQFLGGWPEVALLEALLRSLRRSPTRIDEVAKLIADLGQTEEGEGLLPEGFAAIWKPVWEARGALRQ